LSAECNGNVTKVELKIEYSPFDSLDQQVRAVDGFCEFCVVFVN
jgi:hypothetical protein